MLLLFACATVALLFALTIATQLPQTEQTVKDNSKVPVSLYVKVFQVATFIFMFILMCATRLIQPNVDADMSLYRVTNQPNLQSIKLNNTFSVQTLLVPAGAWNIRDAITIFFGLSALGQLSVLMIGRYHYTNADAAAYFSITSRLIEYSMSSPIMLVSIAVITLIRDVYTLLLIAMGMFATNMLGIAAHSILHNGNDRKTALGMHLAGWVTCLASYGIVLYTYFDATKDGFDRKWIVDTIIITTFVFFNLFGLVQVIDMCTYGASGAISNTTMAFIYDVLSMSSKAVLGLVVMTSVIQDRNWRIDLGCSL